MKKEREREIDKGSGGWKEKPARGAGWVMEKIDPRVVEKYWSNTRFDFDVEFD